MPLLPGKFSSNLNLRGCAPARDAQGRTLLCRLWLIFSVLVEPLTIYRRVNQFLTI